ncbi:C1q-like domain-containing protein [Paenibacillus glycanilyticus]|uniref:C1q-like domain-containing protein n=1 Tax=Paenibacillus glycanilyticus TaxID=126569 RepID=UPI0024E11744|nr:hypothetical protein [Paenibacillus glycanilyticus]
MKKQAVRIAAKGSVKANKAVRTSGYGHGSCTKKCGHGSSKYGGSSTKKSGYGCKKKSEYGYKTEKKVCKTVKYVCKPVSKKTCKKAVVARKSAFRAVSAIAQSVIAGATVQVNYGIEQYDLGREYNPATSTFRPKQSGIYSFIASVFFTSTNDPASFGLAITVNGVPVATETTSSASGGVTLDVSTIVKLRSGDDVQVEFFTSLAGSIVPSSATHFEGVLNRITK